ncbi:predicted protein [Naegleria gruberi]|uniref:Predicted protein n=1 Tax=Naegleria gruberi TaxID=5762 RepID=D2VPY0_NAEGR|nr:uncharacterized protein NAEGRDRAFT_71093 [Naegleria gruberi]EFC41082.1 predicted protein [Naegleria gruberi]|eukprot:XP_002673826.1 predicted protein [Naegleria gruberi strain NEG-M]
MIEHFGHVILKDTHLINILVRRNKGRKYWGCKIPLVMGDLTISKVPLEWRANKELVLANVHHEQCFPYLSDELKNDRDVVLHLLRFGKLFAGIPDHFLKEKQFILDSIRNNVCIYESVSDTFRNDRDVIYQAVERSSHLPELFIHIPSQFFNDREFALFTFKIMGKRSPNLESAKDLFNRLSPELKKDPYIILEGFKHGCCPYSTIIEETMQNDLEFTRNAYNLNNLHLKVPEKFKTDGRVILQYLISEKKTTILKYLTDDLKKNKRFFLDAIQQCDPSNNTYELAFEEVKRDHDVSIAAISRFPKMLDKIPHELKQNKSFVLRLLKIVKPNKVFSLIRNELKTDQDIMIQAIRESADIIKTSELKSDKTFVMKALKFNPEILKHVSAELKNDREVVSIAVQQDGQSIFHASKGLKNERDLILLAASNSISVLDKYSSLSDDPDVIELMIRKQPSLLQSRKFKHLAKDKEFMLKLISKTKHFCFYYLADELKADKSFMLQVVKYDGYTLPDCPDKLDKDIVRETLKLHDINVNVLGLAAKAPFIDEEFLLESCRYNMKCIYMTLRLGKFNTNEPFLASLAMENLRFKVLEKGEAGRNLLPFITSPLVSFEMYTTTNKILNKNYSLTMGNHH